MRDYLLQAEQALRVYLERGASALASATADKIDEANEFLRWRTAAFHNFRAAEAELLKESKASSATYLFASFGQAIAEQNAQLESILEEKLAATKQQVTQAQTKRQALSRFHSGSVTQSRWQDQA